MRSVPIQWYTRSMSLSLEIREAHNFLGYLRLKNLSSETIRVYAWVLMDFFRSCPDECTTLADVTFECLRDYIAGMQSRGRAPKTVADRVLILKRFFGYLITEEHLSTDPSERLPIPKVGKRLPKALTLEEMEAFLSALPSDWKTSAPSKTREALSANARRRDRVLFELLYAGGLRVSEALGLRAADIDFGDGSVRVVGKGDRERRIYLKPRLLELLHEYVEAERLTEYIFPGRAAKSLSLRYVEMRIKQYAKAAGITRPVTPHTLRHSIAVHYLQGGAPVNFVQGLLGHASLATTGKYLQLTDRMAKEIALKTETARDRARDTENGRKMRERREQYKPDAREGDAFVTLVLEWLSW